jgi:gamma-glutamyltranspeptidase/glutathione hydrolase
MSMKKRRAVRKTGTGLLVAAAAILTLACSAAQRGPADAGLAAEPKGLVVSSHPAASRAGLEALRKGGNAVDAAVATGLALGVVDQVNSGLGGGGFLLLRLCDGRVLAIDGRERAPAASSRDMFARGGRADPASSRLGPLAVGVPGILAAYEKALEVAGTMALEELIQPAVALAEKGFALDGSLVSRTAEALEALRLDPASARIYFRADGSPFAEGDLFRQPDLAETLRRIAAEGSAYFYKGEFARRLASYMAEEGGLVSLEDMRGYEAVLREPVVGTYRGCTVFGMPPPGSGGVHVIQILNMLEASRVLEGKMGWCPETVFWTSRFMSRAFEDRAAHLGDGDFHPVPVERLVSKEYAREIVSGLRKGMPACAPDAAPGVPAAAGHTASLVVIDRAENVAVVNQTVNLSYGAKVTLPGTGVILNNEMDDFSAQPGAPNAFGLVGSEANSIAPGKRPLSSMSPTIVVKGLRPVLALGGAGGPTIITSVLQVIVNVLDHRMDLPSAVSCPRFHHQFLPDVLVVEQAFSLARGLREEGWEVETVVREHLGVVNAVAWSEGERAYVGVSDPRARGSVERVMFEQQTP